MSVKTFAVDSNNDLFINPLGNMAISLDIQAVLENCEHAIKTMLNECVLDLQRGMPNFQTIWKSGALLPQYNTAAINTLRKVAGVVNIVSFNSALIDGSVNYQAVILTAFGTGEINGL